MVAAVIVASLFSVLESPAQSAPSWPPQSDQFRFHMIGNAHIDPVWLWPWSEGVSVVHSTFRSALDRMNEDPDVAMTTSSSQFYEWVAENDPAMLAEIRKRVDEGRWDLVGGWWIEPDVNIPNGESLARQGLYGQKTLKNLFGRTAKVGYNPDSFGHPGSLPQILKLEGMEDYVFMRPGVNEKKVPGNLFWWQGIDGSRVLDYRIPISYNDGSVSIEPQMRRTMEELTPQPLRDAMEFFGIGDHGGGPTKANMASIRKIQSEPGAPKILYSTPDRYFAEIRQSHGADIPVLSDDLQHHSVGCYTAESSIKKGNREAEAALVTAEKLSAVGSFAWGAHYPKDEFTAAWKRVLFLQFHDSLAGTALPEHYKTAHEGQGRAIDVAQQAMYLSAQRLAWQVPAVDPASNYLFVFNPHAWSSTQNIEYDLGLSDKDSYQVEDEEGAPVRFQWVQATTAAQSRRRIVAQVSLPPFGYRQIRIRRATAASSTPENSLKAESNVLENANLRVTFSPEGTIGIFDKASGREVFRGGQTGARAVVFSDKNDTWAHNLVAYTDEIGAFKLDSIKLVESGPLRARIRVHSVYGNSSLTIDWILYAGSGRLEARVALDWHEHMKMLKFSFPVDVEAPKATYEIDYGAMERATKGEEDPGQRWVDVSGTGDSYGLAVINDAKYGYSVNGSDLRVSVARGAVYANHMPQKIDPDIDYQWQDQGLQTFRMVLVPHSGFWPDAGVVRIAEELVAPALVLYQGIHPGTRPQSQSFVSVDVPDVVISAIKMAEEGDALIVRLYETDGVDTTATLDLHFANSRWKGKLHPFEIKTLRIDPHSLKLEEVNILEY
jgi:alpha-mannosidase